MDNVDQIFNNISVFTSLEYQRFLPLKALQLPAMGLTYFGAIDKCN